MKFAATRSSPRELKTDLLGIAFAKDEILSSFGREIDQSLDHQLSKIIKKEKLNGKVGETRLVDVANGIGAGSVLLIGFGDPKKWAKNSDRDVLRKASSRLLRAGNRIRAAKISLDVPPSSKDLDAQAIGQSIAEGVLLGNYSFDTYKSKDTSDKKTVTEVEILTSPSKEAAVQRGAERGRILAESTNFARDLINTPACDMTPRHMADEAKKLARLPHLTVKIHDQAAIRRLGMGCYLAVAGGSAHPPYLLHVTYRPPGPSEKKAKKKIVVIGKGITFDSGGLSIKTASSMETMKDDMSGAAAMLGIMRALSTLKPAVEVHGISAVAENMPSGSADRPGDIVRSMNGKSVEILNTDAEGRLTLADALTYAQREKPDVLINMATLTGACVVALGDLCSGIMGNNQALIDRLIRCGKVAGEKIWQLPLVEEYKEELKSPVADLKNVGGRWGGAINAGLFLQEFVDAKVPWAHIDIAGPSWTEKELDDCPKGGTGFSVRTLLHFLLEGG